MQDVRLRTLSGSPTLPSLESVTDNIEYDWSEVFIPEEQTGGSATRPIVASRRQNRGRPVSISVTGATVAPAPNADEINMVQSLGVNTVQPQGEDPQITRNSGVISAGNVHAIGDDEGPDLGNDNNGSSIQPLVTEDDEEDDVQPDRARDPSPARQGYNHAMNLEAEAIQKGQISISAHIILHDFIFNKKFEKYIRDLDMNPEDLYELLYAKKEIMQTVIDKRIDKYTKSREKRPSTTLLRSIGGDNFSVEELSNGKFALVSSEEYDDIEDALSNAKTMDRKVA